MPTSHGAQAQRTPALHDVLLLRQAHAVAVGDAMP